MCICDFYYFWNFEKECVKCVLNWTIVGDGKTFDGGPVLNGGGLKFHYWFVGDDDDVDDGRNEFSRNWKGKKNIFTFKL